MRDEYLNSQTFLEHHGLPSIAGARLACHDNQTCGNAAQRASNSRPNRHDFQWSVCTSSCPKSQRLSTPALPDIIAGGLSDGASAVDEVQIHEQQGMNRPDSGTLSGVSWNCRSLWAQNEADTIRFIEYLLTAHDYAALQETRETDERMAFLRQVLPDNIKIFSTGISQFSGGVAIIVTTSFLDKFSAHEWTTIEEGRVGRLRLDSPYGRLDLCSVYLDHESNQAQHDSINMLSDALDKDAHNIISGDFNFTLHSGDRITKAAQIGGDASRDNSRAKCWNEAMKGKLLQEFEQTEFTCENSHGWSRIDRVYTSLHPAVIATMSTGCTAIDYPRKLSDHRPLSFFFRRFPQRTTNPVPPWITEHPDFTRYVEAEYERRTCETSMTPFEMLDELKDSIRIVSKRLIKEVRRMTAQTVAHQLSVTLSFIRAAETNDLGRAKKLQLTLPELAEVDFGAPGHREDSS